MTPLAFIKKIANRECTHPYCDYQAAVLKEPRTSCAPDLAKNFLAARAAKKKKK